MSAPEEKKEEQAVEEETGGLDDEPDVQLCLKSQDMETFNVPREIAMMSALIKTMYSGMYKIVFFVFFLSFFFVCLFVLMTAIVLHHDKTIPKKIN